MNLVRRAVTASTANENPPESRRVDVDDPPPREMWNDEDDDHPAISEQNNGKSIIQLLTYATVTIFLVLTVASKGSSLMIKNDNYNLYDQYLRSKEGVTNDIDEVGVGSPVLPVTKTKQGGKQSTTNISDLQLPRILLAGVQKSGSTAVADFLHRAGVCLSRPNPAQDIEQKSVYYFDKNYDRGIDYYASMFAHCNDKEGVGKKVGMDLATDATPNNFRMAHRIRQTYDQVSSDQLEKLKIIVVVREPVARELSWYNHLVSECIKRPNEQCKKKISRDGKTSKKNKGVTDPSKNIKSFPEYAEYLFGEFMDGKPIPIEKRLPSSFYERYLTEWYEMFNPKQILFLNYSELKQDERNFLKRIASFLELDVDDSLMDGGTSTINTQQKGGMKVSAASCDLQQRLAAAYEEHNEKFYKMLDKADGPRHQQKPFPRFELSNCTDTSTSTAAVTKL